MSFLSTAPVAQWIARWTSNPKVVGSSPTWGSTFMFACITSISPAAFAAVSSDQATFHH